MASRASLSLASSTWPSCVVSPGSQPAGISSVPISRSSSLSISRVSTFAAPMARPLRRDRRFFDVTLANRERELTDAEDVGHSLGDADAAAGVEQVEQMRALQAMLERGQNQPALQQLFAELVGFIEQMTMECRVALAADAGLLIEGVL